MSLKKAGALIVDFIEVVVFAIAIFLFVYLLILQPHKIKGASMEPNFPNGEYLLTDKVTYRLREPERGDVVVFKAPQANGDEFIKRIIGEPGETITIKDGFVFINRKRLVENYLPKSVKTEARSFLKEGQEIKIPGDQYVVLGDNRPFSSDSRDWGFVTKIDMTGRAWLIYWPISEVGTVPEIQYNY